jgi:RNA polymerase sigma factor for flagellar operon FliA
VSLWGKWRPSAEARRAGPVGIRLEMLMRRDGLSFDEASEILITNEGVALSRAALRAIGDRLPARVVRRFVSEELLAERADPRMDVEAEVLRVEQTTARGRLAEDLAQAIQAVPAEDRLIVQMRFEQGLTVAQIASLLHQPAKPLYRRIERLLAGLRRTLEARGYTANEAVQAIDGANPVPTSSQGPENGPREPSFISRSRT